MSCSHATRVARLEACRLLRKSERIKAIKKKRLKELLLMNRPYGNLVGTLERLIACVGEDRRNVRTDLMLLFSQIAPPLVPTHQPTTNAVATSQYIGGSIRVDTYLTS